MSKDVYKTWRTIAQEHFENYDKVWLLGSKVVVFFFKRVVAQDFCTEVYMLCLLLFWSCHVALFGSYVSMKAHLFLSLSLWFFSWFITFRPIPSFCFHAGETSSRFLLRGNTLIYIWNKSTWVPLSVFLINSLEVCPQQTLALNYTALLAGISGCICGTWRFMIYFYSPSCAQTHRNMALILISIILAHFFCIFLLDS